MNTLHCHLGSFYSVTGDYKKKGWGFNQFCKIDGAFYTTEYTYNEKTKQWHPHIHIFALLNQWIDQEELAETWHDITLDSYIVDIRRVKKTKEHGYAKGVAEVCKYALKFSDLSMENTFHAFLTFERQKAHWLIWFYARFEN